MSNVPAGTVESSHWAAMSSRHATKQTVLSLRRKQTLTWQTCRGVSRRVRGRGRGRGQGRGDQTPGGDKSPPRDSNAAAPALTFHAEPFRPLLRLCPAKKRKNQLPAEDSDLSSWELFAARSVSLSDDEPGAVFWLVEEEMKFEEEEGALTDSYRRVRAPDLYMRVTGAGQPIKKKLCTSLIYWD